MSLQGGRSWHFKLIANVAALNVYNNLGVHQAKAADSLSRISSGLKAAGAGDMPVREPPGFISNMQATNSNISQVQAAINQLQVADAAYGEVMAPWATKGQQVAISGANAGADTSAVTAQLVAITRCGIASIQTYAVQRALSLRPPNPPNIGVGALTVTQLQLPPLR